ncbi:hypothetical protein FIBSPDRAFT_947026 [Athelia psychrophila]|uniref:Uncharacterized protein n=1 Tax=Athelia psychrophila TaxID=1759441 RepID=A0A166S4S1_9AGAM|nr:hypothetical protein FIBSPDRAFT_947026 [Fibularhizoctonia sp. CBS 109695]
MSLSLYAVSVPPFLQGLRVLSHLLKKGQDHAATGAVTEDKLIQSKLIEDMGGLPYQIYRVSDTAKGVATRIGGAAPVSMPDTQVTFPELHQRIEDTIKILEALKADSMDGKNDAEITLGERKMKGEAYIINYAVPNFYFHLVTAYALLRKEGVPVGKKDYLGVNL